MVKRDNYMVLHCTITFNLSNQQVISIKPYMLAPFKGLSGTMDLHKQLASVLALGCVFYGIDTYTVFSRSD